MTAARRPSLAPVHSRARAVVGAALALAALAAFVMIPLALWAWRGMPLPSTWEPARWMTLARRGYLHPDVLPNVLAALIWAMWAQVALALLRESAARLGRGASATRTTLLPSVIQHLAGSWIASLSILLSLAAGRTAVVATSLDIHLADSAGGVTQTVAAPAAVPPDGSEAGLAGPATRPVTDGTGPAGTVDRRHVVAPGENLWIIVDDEYPDLEPADLPAAVAGVFETNRGVTDPHGRVLRDPKLINPGMELRLPAFTAGHHPGAIDQNDRNDQTDGSDRADGMPRDVAPTPSEPPPSPAPPQPAAETPGQDARDSSTSSPGSTSFQERGVAPAPHPSPAPTPSTDPGEQSGIPTPATVTPAIPQPSPAGPAAHHGHPAASPEAEAEEKGEGEPAVSPVTWIGGAGLLATTIVGLWAARRRRRDNTVTPSQHIPAPDQVTADLHAALLDADDPDLLDRLDAALHSIGAAHDGQPDGPSPQILLVHPDQSIEVFLHPDGAHTLPPPWEPGPDPRLWNLPATETPASDPAYAPICPALIQLGTTPTGAAVFADLEALGSLGIDTSPVDSDQLADLGRAILAAIVASPWAGLTTVRTVGLNPHAFTGEERVQATDDVVELTEQARSDAAALDAALRQGGYRSTLNARIAEPGEEFDPTIALLTSLPDTDVTRAAVVDLAAAAGSGRRGLAVVLPAEPGIPTSWTLRPNPDHASGGLWRLDPLGVTLIPTGLTDTDHAALGALIVDAETPPVDLPPDPPAETPEPFVPPPWEVMVRLLGPVDVTSRDGRTAPQDETRERTNEVLAWLVTHRHGTRIDLESALWPRGATPKTLANALSRVRRLLANLVGPEAQDWLPRFDRTTLTLDRRVVSDLEILQALLRHAMDQRDHRETAITTLHEALDLIRGVPAGYPWLDAQMGSILTTTPVNAAILLAEHQLATGDVSGVLATTARGLELLPAHTTLFALRMRAHAAAGDTAAVKAEYRSYLRAEKAEPLWDGDTDRELEALHHNLTHRGQVASA
ncbi:SARP family transcriptional regulator [Parafrankia elaeagni]|uniref:SARP family transcriptional regulator n=1 Tax=Parafrankia elaeagni TaxID=222534 RepID=UPI0018A848B6|nr:SARP family transcriptional regulator [Parafrankia elaeagni]